MWNRLNKALFPHLIALACIGLVTVVYLWPLLTNLTRAMPGTADDPDVATMVWNVGWVEQVLRRGGDLLYSDLILDPYGADLRLHTYGLLQGLMAFPFTSVVGVVGAFNLMTLLTMFLNGALLYWLINGEIGSSDRGTLPALIAAVWTMLGTPLLFQLAVGRPSFGSVWVVAGALLALRGLLDRPRWRKALALGGWLVAALLTDFQILLFSALWLALYGMYRLLCDGRQILSLKRLLGLGLSAAIVGLPFIVIFYPALADSRVTHQQPRLDDMVLYSFRFWDYFTPTGILLAYGYELLAAAIAALVVFRWRGRYRFWLVGTGLMLALALGPYLQTPAGTTTFPLPFGLFSLWPPLSNFRTPYRFTMPALIGLGVVAGLVLDPLLRRLSSRRWLVLLALIGIGGRLAFALIHDPLPVQVYPDYAIYARIAHEPGTFTVLEVPLGIRSGLDHIGRGGEVLQYYQLVHRKRIINGMVARLPADVFRFYRVRPSLLLLAGVPMPISPPQIDRDFAEVLSWSQARYLLVHRSLLSESELAGIETFLKRQTRLERLPDEADLMIYRVVH